MLQLYLHLRYTSDIYFGYACMHIRALIAAILHVDVPWLYTLRAGILGIKLGYTSGILNSDILQIYFGYVYAAY
jgi:hypothetical protein